MGWFKKKPQQVDCQTHVLDTIKGEHVKTIIVGTDVDRKKFDRFSDKSGHLYIVVHYEKGLPLQNIVTREIWEAIKRDVFSTSRLSSIEEYFDYHYDKLLLSDPNVQLITASAMNTLWIGFNLRYPDFDVFRGSDDKSKSTYLSKMTEMIDAMASAEMDGQVAEGTSRGAILHHLYLTAVSLDDVKLVNKIADSLEPFNKLAHDMLHAGGIKNGI